MSTRFALPVTGSSDPGNVLPPQSKLDAYEVEALIAQGRFALIYRAVHTATQKVVAIKEYFPEAIALRHASHRVTPRSSNGIERFGAGRRAFVEEARSLARFDDASLVRVLSLFETNGTAYRVMRFTPGPTLLAHRLALGRMPAVEDFRRWVDGLLGALATLHHAGCVHGAVAPANILLQSGERPLLLGFDSVRRALAPARGSDTVQSIDEGRLTSKARASPAHIAEAAAADLRALAATFKYCIEGGVPDARSLAEAWQREGGPMPIPQGMVRLLHTIDACLSEDPDRRPQSVDEFRRSLHEAAAPVPLRAAAAAIEPGAACPAPHANVASIAAAKMYRDARADLRGREDPTTGRDPSPDAEAVLESASATTTAVEVAAEEPSRVPAEVGSEVAAQAAAEPEAAAEAELEAGANPAASADESEPRPHPGFEGEAEAVLEAEVTAEVEAGADETPGNAADDPAPTQTADEAPWVPSGTVSIGGNAAMNRVPFPRRAAAFAAFAVAASVVLGIGVTVWGDRRGDSQSPPPPAPPTETHESATPHPAAAEPEPAVAAVSAPIPVSMAPQKAESPPAAITAARAEAPPPTPIATKRPLSASGDKTPAASPKAAIAAAKTKSPSAACQGRKGFALYQCVQLQCAKPASADHADCVSLP